MGFWSKLLGPRREVLPVSVRGQDEFRAEVLQSPLPVIVDVWGPSCAPCKMLEPVMVDIATRYEGRVRVVEVSTEGEPALLSRLGVMATPTVLVFHQGKEFGRVSGYHPASWFEEMIEAEFPEGAGAESAR